MAGVNGYKPQPTETELYKSIINDLGWCLYNNGSIGLLDWERLVVDKLDKYQKGKTQ